VHNKKTAISKIFKAVRIGYHEKLRLSVQSLIDSGIVNPQKFVCGSNHVNSVRFALGAFPVKELINRFKEKA
jgi:hypothetical protein